MIDRTGPRPRERGPLDRAHSAATSSPLASRAERWTTPSSPTRARRRSRARPTLGRSEPTIRYAGFRPSTRPILLALLEDADPLAVRLQGDAPVPVGAVEAEPRHGLEGGERRRGRVPVAVEPAGRDDRDLRSQAREDLQEERHSTRLLVVDDPGLPLFGTPEALHGCV